VPSAADLESERAERKESFAPSVRDRVAQAVCAFANDLPASRQTGVVLVGVTDSGQPTGLPITDTLLAALGGLRSDGKILPLPQISVRKVALPGGEAAAVEVAPSADTPVRYDGRIWIRVGPRRAVASRDEERVLTERRQWADRTFDRQPCRGATVADLDLEFFRSHYLPRAVSPEVIAENRRSVAEQLAALHLLAPNGEPSRATMLLLGRDPLAWLPGAYVQFVRFAGPGQGSAIVDQKILRGRLGDVARDADHLARLNIRVALQIAGATPAFSGQQSAQRWLDWATSRRASKMKLPCTAKVLSEQTRIA